jgi:hypothetical protein
MMRTLLGARMTRLRAIRLRVVVAAAVAVAIAAVLSGCVAITDETSSQLDIIGSVRLNTGVCLGSTLNSCPRTNTTASEPNNGDMQFLVGYRIPSGASPPNTWTGTETSTGETITFTRSASYSSELQRLSPAPSGQQWVGYLSSVHHHPGNATENFSFQTDFGLVQGPEPTPFKGPFLYRTVVGRRTVNPSGNGSTPPQPADRPVSCGDSLTGGDFDSSSPEFLTVCADSPSPEDISTNRSQPTRDLAVQCQGPNQVQASRPPAAINFNLLYAGESHPDANFAITATTTVPGGTVTPSTNSVNPDADSTTGVGTSVAVPASTPAGAYDVTLTAALSNGQSRTNHCTLNVSTAPPVKVGLIGVRKACASAPFSLTVNATRLAVTGVQVLLDGRQVATSSQARSSLRIDPRRLRVGRHRIRVVVTDAAGRTTTRDAVFTVCSRRAAPKPRRVVRGPRFTG